MRSIVLSSVVAAAFLGGCATTEGGSSSMSAAELSECLQPNRRVVVEIGGRRPAPPPKPKPGAEPPKKPAKPQFVNVALKANVQGNTAFDVGSAVLKDGGKKEIDSLVAQLAKGPVQVGAVIVSGHTDRNEAKSASKTLAEDRAKSVVAYMTSKGVDQKLVFWEGKGDKEPVPVTKFCQ